MRSVDNGSTWTAKFNALGQQVEQVGTGWGKVLVYDAGGQEFGTFDGVGSVWLGIII